MRTLLLLLLFFTCLGVSSSQNAAPFFKNEIALDVAPWVRSDWGGSIIFKKGFWQNQDEKWQKQHALRLLAGLYQEEISAGYFYVRGDSLNDVFSTSPKRTAFFYVGDELQIKRKRWRFHFGLDLGFRHATSTADFERRITSISTDTLLGRDFYQDKFISNGVRLAALGGVDFYLSPRLSLGLEMGFEGGPSFERSDVSRVGQPTFKDKGVIFESGLQVLRFLYVAWHFGKPASE